MSDFKNAIEEAAMAIPGSTIDHTATGVLSQRKSCVVARASR